MKPAGAVCTGRASGRWRIFAIAVIAAAATTACVRNVDERATRLADGLCLVLAHQEDLGWPKIAEPAVTARMTVEAEGSQLRVTRVASCPPAAGAIRWDLAEVDLRPGAVGDTTTLVPRPDGEWTFALSGTPALKVTRPDGTRLAVTIDDPAWRDAVAWGLLDGGRLWFEPPQIDPRATAPAAVIVDLATERAWSYTLDREGLKAVAPGQETVWTGREVAVTLADVTPPPRAEPGEVEAIDAGDASSDVAP